MEVVLSSPPEYLRFVTLVNGKIPTEVPQLQNNIKLWPYWATFMYPALMKNLPASKLTQQPSKRPPLKPLNEIYKKAEIYRMPDPKPPSNEPSGIRCTEKGCNKTYRQYAGLQYHMQRVHNVAGLKPLTLSLICPFQLCQKNYSSITGIRNHLKNCHLQPIHFKEDHLNSQEKDIVPNLKCPVYPCKAKACTQSQMRIHILKNHFWSYSNSQHVTL
ncbi:hypothetical protein DSO57_1038116 [Entomophthora muscae]|uniref:Uncharacterized protein n=1 Tax=Entomophthora muscae TaxID=34485 RepID=A0ACC2U974_9FUNG|nr:hypothetical protein DSO57_1038116 [Entomophthora muscae]